MKASIAPAQTDEKDRIVRAAVTAVYDRYCSSSIAELESAVVSLMGQPLPDDEDEDHVVLDSRGSDSLRDPLLDRGQGVEAIRRQRRADPVLTPAPAENVQGPKFGSHGSATAVFDVIAERLRQQEKESFDASHDDMATRGQLAGAGACYALTGIEHWAKDQAIKILWPWADEWWKPTDRRRDLIKAAALLIAEIERLDRAALKSGGSADEA